MKGQRVLSWAIFVVLICAVAAGAYLWRSPRPAAPHSGLGHLSEMQGGKGIWIDCKDVAASTPMTVVALGQSNAGNHGAPDARNAPEVTVFFDGQCFRTTDPLPGGTGEGGSIWSRMTQLLEGTQKRPVLLAVLAVDATTIDDWTGDTQLTHRLIGLLDALAGFSLSPDAVLWQQGESDAKLGKPADEFEKGLQRLVDLIRSRVVEAPIYLAASTVCRSPASSEILLARKAVIEKNKGVFPGAETDLLLGEMRFDGCHFSEVGRYQAAELWVNALRKAPASK